MQQLTLKPYCVAKPRDNIALAPLLGIFKMASVDRLGLCAIAQPYLCMDAPPRKDGVPVLLQRDPDDGSITSVDVNALDDGSTARADAEILTRHLYDMPTPDTLLSNMFQITARHLWLFVFPQLIILQANNILDEMRNIEKVSKDIRNSTWARAAYATLRFPPASNHAALTLLPSALDALDVVAQFRSEPAAAARAEGYDLGLLEYGDLKSAEST